MPDRVRASETTVDTEGLIRSLCRKYFERELARERTDRRSPTLTDEDFEHMPGFVAGVPGPSALVP